MIKVVEHNSIEYHKSVKLRDAVLREPLNLEFSQEELAAEKDSFHLVYETPGREIIGVLIMKPLSEFLVKMRQVAVHPNYQGKGIGKELVEYAENFAERQFFTMIELHAREVVVPFYLALDYEVVGEQFEEVGLPHYKMIKFLTDLGEEE